MLSAGLVSVLGCAVGACCGGLIYLVNIKQGHTGGTAMVNKAEHV